MIKKIKSTKNLLLTDYKIGVLKTRLNFIAKNDFSYSLYDYLNGYESEIKTFKKNKIIVVKIATVRLPFISEKDIINIYLK